MIAKHFLTCTSRYINQNKLCALIIIICLGIYTTQISAQTLSIVKCQILPSDKSAETSPRLDGNDVPCALVKVKTDGLEDLIFKNHSQYIGDIDYIDGTYYVYMPATTYKLDFEHAKFLPGTINLYESFGYKVKSGKTYLVTMIENVPKNVMNVSAVVFQILPVVNGILKFNGIEHNIPSNGRIEIQCEPGTYNYIVKCENYEDAHGNVTISNNVTPKKIRLIPKTAEVKIDCNVSSAHVYVDDVDYGRVGNVQLPLGKHTLRFSADGYLDETEENYNLTQFNNQIEITLKKNKGKIVEIHPVAIKIICNSKKLYKNNKPYDGWQSGSEVLFMPGAKCVLSDDAGNRYKFVAGSESTTITLEDGIIIYGNYSRPF